MLIVLPSLVSGAGIAFLLLGIFIDQKIIRIVFVTIGVLLLWLDFFISMAILRHSMRSIDSRLHRIEDDVLNR
ncbi:hypothetical protein J0H33_02885 [bacterium]|jgi:hypothetical protein|nr:hypothetical protein [bacterium]